MLGNTEEVGVEEKKIANIGIYEVRKILKMKS